MSRRLTIHFGERGRSAGRPLADQVFDCLGRHGIGEAVLLRAGEGFGPRHGLQTSSQLSLSEDLPLVLAALGDRAGVDAAAEAVRSMFDEGLVTLETVDFADRDGRGGVPLPGDYCRMTAWMRRGARSDGRAAHEVVARCLRDSGADASITLLGVDGMVSGTRRRAGFFSANRDVPLLVSAIGTREALDRAVRAAGEAITHALVEVSVAEILARDRYPYRSGAGGDGALHRVVAYHGGLPPGGGVDRQQRLVRDLRRAGASGATALQGIFGFAGDQDPHGESFTTLRRRIPVVTEIVDTPDRCAGRVGGMKVLYGPGSAAAVQRVEVVERPAFRD